MISAKTYDIREQAPVSSRRSFPAASFPRGYIHSIVEDLHSAVQAVYALRAIGYDARDVHVMAGWDYQDAVEQRSQQQGRLGRALARLFSFFDEGLDDIYLREVSKGRHFLAVRLTSKEQMVEVRNLLVSCHAHHIKYVDTWTVTDLMPANAREVQWLALKARLLHRID